MLQFSIFVKMIELNDEIMMFSGWWFGCIQRWASERGDAQNTGGDTCQIANTPNFPFVAKSCQAFQLSIFNGGSKPKKQNYTIDTQHQFLSCSCLFIHRESMSSTQCHQRHLAGWISDQSPPRPSQAARPKKRWSKWICCWQPENASYIGSHAKGSWCASPLFSLEGWRVFSCLKSAISSLKSIVVVLSSTVFFFFFFASSHQMCFQILSSFLTMLECGCHLCALPMWKFESQSQSQICPPMPVISWL